MHVARAVAAGIERGLLAPDASASLQVEASSRVLTAVPAGVCNQSLPPQFQLQEQSRVVEVNGSPACHLSHAQLLLALATLPRSSSSSGTGSPLRRHTAPIRLTLVPPFPDGRPRM